jgi:Spy/CpxP family protein refolding chaperone
MTSRAQTPRRLAALAALLALCVLAVAALAQPEARAGGDRRVAVTTPNGGGDATGPEGRRLAHLARRLDLNDTQRDAVAKIETAARARDLPLRRELQRLRHELQGEMMKDAPTGSAVTALARQIGDVRTKLQTGHLLDRLAVRQVLTPEQRDRLLLMGERGDGPGFGPRRGPGGPRGRGGWDGPRHGRGGRFPDGAGPDGPGGARRLPGNGD